MGQEVRTLVEGEKAIGYYTDLWDAKDNSGNDVASGVSTGWWRVITPKSER